jgi:phage-related protein
MLTGAAGPSRGARRPARSFTVTSRRCWTWHIISKRIYSPVAHKPVRWLGNSRAAVRAFPPDARRDAGYQVYRVQQGHAPSDWKPMPDVGAGVREIRVHAGGEYRVLYLATQAEAVYVLHAFVKKRERTPKLDRDLARTRLKELLRRRRQD